MYSQDSSPYNHDRHTSVQVMWLLSTSCAELKDFVSSESVGGYAILSHVWNTDEQSYQDIQALRALCAQTEQNPRNLASDKIRRCCELAERHGYLWLWIDTCCIDKTSSAELSEAINSRYRYYSLADVCYASRWHLRGWTLQELVAPKQLLFISQSWDVLGSKAELATVLETTTGVPATVLRFQQRVVDISIAQRMSWAAFRTTTRVEDEAYCLMGIFGVNMPTLYGEGRAAFQRLQEEILRRHADTTLFAWGLSCESAQLRYLYLYGTDLCLTSLPHNPEHPEGSSVFATSPAAFADSDREITYVPLGCQSDEYCSDTAQRSIGGVPTFSVTSHGVHARIRIIECDGVTIADLSWMGHGDVPLGLVLTPCLLSADPARPLYDIGVPDRSLPGRYVRVARLPTSGRDGRAVAESDGHALIRGSWRDVCLAHRRGHEGLPPRAEIPRPLGDNGFSAPFRFRQRHGEVLLSPASIELLSVDPELPLPWTGSAPMMLSFAPRSALGAPSFTPGPRDHAFSFVLMLGRCTHQAHARLGFPRSHVRIVAEPALGPHWATVQFSRLSHPVLGSQLVPSPPVTTPPHHDCTQDHICDWPGGSNLKTFEIVWEEAPETTSGTRIYSTSWKSTVSLSFSPCPLSPEDFPPGRH
ncbi:hypothetical protein C8T65DRAFT_744963 [Cerioporus squamosus]|nr:hypothetical protein C8T65DRAFT_744963 [Cerioporus squamosus]